MHVPYVVSHWNSTLHIPHIIYMDAYHYNLLCLSLLIDAVCLGLIWDSDQPPVDDIMAVVNNIGLTLQLSDVSNDYHDCISKLHLASACTFLFDDPVPSSQIHIGSVYLCIKYYQHFFCHTCTCRCLTQCRLRTLISTSMS